MNKIPTAEECFNNFVDFEICPLKEYTPKQLINDTKLVMIEFAKLHVEAALKAVHEYYEVNYDIYPFPENEINVDTDIYPLEQIK